MWKPTAGKVKGKYFVEGGFFSSSYGVLVCESHTGKVFEVDVPWGQAVGTDIGQAIFCNGDFCRRMRSYGEAVERLNEVNAGEPRTNTSGEEPTTPEKNRKDWILHDGIYFPSNNECFAHRIPNHDIKDCWDMVYKKPSKEETATPEKKCCCEKRNDVY